MEKKKIIYVIGGAILLILLGVSLIGNKYKYRGIHYYDGGEILYYDDDNYLKLFFDEGEYYEDIDKYFYFSSLIKTNKIKIIHWDDKEIVIRIKDNVSHFYSKNNKIKPKAVNINLSGNSFKNDESEIYFYKDWAVIAGESFRPRRVSFTFSSYGYNYLDLYFFDKIDYPEERGRVKNFFSPYKTYDSRKKEILGFKKVKFNDLKYINLKYYDNDGNIKDEYNINIDGAYTDDDGDIITIKNNKIIFKTKREEKEYDFILMDVSDRYCFYSISYDDSARYYYDKNHNKFCSLLSNNCYTKKD